MSGKSSSRNLLYVVLAIILLLGLSRCGFCAIYLAPSSLSDEVSSTLRPISGSTLKVPLITWGGDVATVHTEMADYFKQKGLSITLFREDDFAKQVDGCISGNSPFIRGTVGMINAAAPALKAAGTELVVIYQMTYSTGGDALVVRPGKTLKNIKTVALQKFGPHADYAGNLFTGAGRLNAIEFRWLKELTLPVYATNNTVDPVTAFQEDTSLDAVMCIIPDALMLTSDGAKDGGSGSEGSVKGATILVSTKTAGKIIADVYAVRKDYYDKNKASVDAFVAALVDGEQSLQRLLKDKGSKQAEYRKLLARSADLLMGAPQATAEIEGMLADCEFVGASGNVAFFTGKGTSRTLAKLSEEAQTSFKTMGIISSSFALNSVGWGATSSVAAIAKAAPKKVVPKFDNKKATAVVQTKIDNAEAESWNQEGTLFTVSITFGPNQKEFNSITYAADFKKALELAQTYSGALIIIEGHSDPLGVLRVKKELSTAKANGDSKATLTNLEATILQKTTSAKTLSIERSNAVRASFLEYCKAQKIEMDVSQFISIGRGVDSPEFNPPKTEAEWAANRRVIFVVKQMEAELSSFSAL